MYDELDTRPWKSLAEPRMVAGQGERKSAIGSGIVANDVQTFAYQRVVATYMNGSLGNGGSWRQSAVGTCFPG